MTTNQIPEDFHRMFEATKQSQDQTIQNPQAGSNRTEMDNSVMGIKESNVEIPKEFSEMFQKVSESEYEGGTFTPAVKSGLRKTASFYPQLGKLYTSALETKPNYGNRPNGEPKGKGYFGEITTPDKKVMTELSIGVDFGNGETSIPSIVPSLTPQEIDHLRKGGQVTPEIYGKSMEHAQMRLSQGMSPYATKEEEGKTPYVSLSQEKPSKFTPNIKRAIKTAIASTGIAPFLESSSAVYDSNPQFFGRTYAEKEAQEGRPIPKAIQESAQWKITEFATMGIADLPVNIATGGSAKLVQLGTRELMKEGLNTIIQKTAYEKGRQALKVYGMTALKETAKSGAKAYVAGTTASNLQEAGTPEWLSDLIGVGVGYGATPYLSEKASIYALNTATNYMNTRANRMPAMIPKTWVNMSTDPVTEFGLGMLQKDMASRNVMRNFISSQDDQFAKALVNVIDQDTSMANDAENFLTESLSSKTNELQTKHQELETQKQQHLTNIGQAEQTMSSTQKALSTAQDISQTKANLAQQNITGQQEATAQLLEQAQPPQEPNIQNQRQAITEEATQNLPNQEISVSDQVIANASRNIQSMAKTPQDVEAGRIIGNIPVTTEAPTQAVANIYDSIAPMIGQPEAGQLFKDTHASAYKIAVDEKKEFYKDLSDKTNESTYEIPEKQFNQFIDQIHNQIETLKGLPFRSPQQERALSKLTEVISGFNDANSFFSLGNGENLDFAQIPTLTKFWEARKSFGQSISWKSNLPADKMLKEQYHIFNQALDRQFKLAGKVTVNGKKIPLIDLYNNANEFYRTRFLPMEQGVNVNVKYLNPLQAGQRLNLEAIKAMSNFLPLSDLNPLRRYAIQKRVGFPRTGELLGNQLQRVQDVMPYLTPNEQAQFNALRNMPLIQARVATKQLGIIENYLEANRDNLTHEVIKQLERVAHELRSNADLPIEYVLGRQQIHELETKTQQDYNRRLEEHKASKQGLKSELRQLKAKNRQEQLQEQERLRQEAIKAKEEKEQLSQEVSTLKGKVSELHKAQEEVGREQGTLEKSLLSTILQQETNTAILDTMKDLKGLRRVQELFGNSPTGKAIFEALKIRKAQEILENASSINMLAKLFNNDESVKLLKELLPTHTYSQLENLAMHATDLRDKLRYFMNTSNTQSVGAGVTQLKGVLQAFMQMFTGNIAKGLGSLTSYIIPSIVKNKLAKLITNPDILSKVTAFYDSFKHPNIPRQVKLAKDLIILFSKLGIIEVSEETNKREEQSKASTNQLKSNQAQT